MQITQTQSKVEISENNNCINRIENESDSKDYAKVMDLVCAMLLSVKQPDLTEDTAMLQDNAKEKQVVADGNHILQSKSSIGFHEIEGTTAVNQDLVETVNTASVFGAENDPAGKTDILVMAGMTDKAIKTEANKSDVSGKLYQPGNTDRPQVTGDADMTDKAIKTEANKSDVSGKLYQPGNTDRPQVTGDADMTHATGRTGKHDSSGGTAVQRIADVYSTRDENANEGHIGDGSVMKNALAPELRQEAVGMHFKDISDRISIYDQLVERVTGSSIGKMMDKGELEIDLKPEFLGKIKIKLVMDKGVLAARITVGNTEVKAAIEDRIGSLQDAFLQKGLVVADLQVRLDNIATAGGLIRYFDTGHSKWENSWDETKEKKNHSGRIAFNAFRQGFRPTMVRAGGSSNGALDFFA